MGSGDLKLAVIPGDPAAIVAAPHGHDYYTDVIVRAVCALTGFCGVTAGHMEDRSDDLRVNVNRPTEGAGRLPDEEVATIPAARAFSEYLEAVLSASGGRIGLYVEVHGNETQEQVEVATVGIPDEERALVKDSLDDIPCGALVEGIDHIVKTASANKEFGVLRAVPRALHFELPAESRSSARFRAACAVSIARAVTRVAEGSGVSPLLALFRGIG